MWKKNSFDGEIPTARPPFVGPQVRIPQKKGRGTSSRLSLSDRLQQNGGNIGSDQTPCNAVTCLDSAYASRFPLLLLLLLLSLSPPSLSLSLFPLASIVASIPIALPRRQQRQQPRHFHSLGIPKKTVATPSLPPSPTGTRRFLPFPGSRFPKDVPVSCTCFPPPLPHRPLVDDGRAVRAGCRCGERVKARARFSPEVAARGSPQGRNWVRSFDAPINR